MGEKIGQFDDLFNRRFGEIKARYPDEIPMTALTQLFQSIGLDLFPHH